MTLTASQQRAAAKRFASDWANRGDEKQDAQRFWIELMQRVFGIMDMNYVLFEQPVKLKHVSYIDGYINATNVLIEQKGCGIDLSKPEPQSDGAMLTPYEQARRYGGRLAHDKNPRWIVVCNFQKFEIHDMNRPNNLPERFAATSLLSMK